MPNKPRGIRSPKQDMDYLGDGKILIFFCHNWISLTVTSENFRMRRL